MPENFACQLKESPSTIKGESNGLVTETDDINLKELKERESKYRLLVENSMDGIYQVDLLGRFVYANRSFTTMLGYGENEIVNKHFSSIVPTRGLLRATKIIKNILTGNSTQGHIDIKRRDGTEFPSFFTSTTLRSDGKIIGLTGSVKDITEEKVKEELKKALSKEKGLNLLKSDFVSMASHEFRTPLTTILSASDNLKRYRDRMTETEVNSKIDKIQSEVKGLTDILNDFLTVGAGETGKIELKVEKIDLKLFLDEEIRSLKDSVAKDHEIDYVFKSAEIVNLDSRIMKHIISNLLSNAIKYSEAGTTIEFHISARNGSLIIQVNDQGIGIPKNDLEDIYIPFHRGSNVGTFQGTGLGMAIVKQSVELHGGQIAIKSREGVGTKIEVVIPLYNDLNNKPIISNKRTSLSH